MNKFRETYGPWACVAGSAEGLGEAFSTALVKRGLNVIMVDHHAETNRMLAERLAREYQVETLPLELDLAEPDAASVIMKKIRTCTLRLLVYNAAYSIVKPFMVNTPEDLDRYIAVNCSTPLQLVLGFAGALHEKKQNGGILLMSSLAGLYGTQLLAAYGATKAFNCLLAEALHHEWKKDGIDVLACIAGATATPAYLATSPDYGWIRPHVMAPAKVAERALDKLGKQARYIPGISNQLMVFIFSRLLPRKAAAGLFNRTTRKMYKKKELLCFFIYFLFSIF